MNLKSGAGFGDPIENKKVEKAAVNYVTKIYKSQEWKVKSVESENKGYDLECTKNNMIEKVEVKGVKGAALSFLITENEVKFAKNDSSFVICIITGALSKNKKLNKYSSKEFIRNFDLKAISYKAVLKGSSL